MTPAKILSTGGRAEINGIVIPPYPKMLHAVQFEEEMLGQIKVNGYNLRLVKSSDELIPILRGGAVDKKTKELIEEHLAGEFTSFFKENPKKVLCMEIIGRKTMAVYKGEKDMDYFVFDIMDLERGEDERFLPFTEVEELCKKHRLNLIPLLGKFDSFDELNDKLLDVEPIYEGVVLKSLDGKRFLKYKWEDNPELFRDKVPVHEKRVYVESDEAKIVGHFFQGYEEKELGLEAGLTPDELQEYEKLVEGLSDVERSKIGEQVSKIAAFLMEKILQRGKFDEDMQKKIEKEFKSKVGKEVGKLIKRVKP